MKKEIEERMANRRRQDEHCFLALTHQDEKRGRTSDAWAESSIAGGLMVVGVGRHNFDASSTRLLQRSCQWDSWTSGDQMKAIGCVGNMPRTMLIEGNDLPSSCRIENDGSIQSNVICPFRVQHHSDSDGGSKEGEP